MESRVKVARHLEPWRDLTGKVVMVTGASSGLGREFSLDLAKAGCRVIAAARRVERLKSLCDEINGFGGSAPRAVAIVLDIGAGGSAVEAAVQKAWAAFGRIDALVNNAGIRGSRQTPFDLTEKEWNDNIRTNLTGTWLVTKYVCLLMRNARLGGSVINISSLTGLNRGQFMGALAYSCSKSAVNTFSMAMALELGAYGIRVNSISPGIFKSEITMNLVHKHWIKNVTHRTVPLRTYGTTDPALTSLVRYLIHDSSEYVSGNIYVVDAGASLPGVPIFSSL
nr:3-oxoacyl-[acyl-carrier-protein] reductase, chloroplastic-like [Ipomoea batatas]GME09482.1 3-oxoacyl-[acyl-carrier-protein] reductase, chloroplastic-like [Ipomoea batatas]